MPIQIYDSLKREPVPFETEEPGRVRMYACGPTVYNYVHIGNARTLVWFDFIRRYLTYRGYDVTYVMNYTDVDDKIIERSKIEKLPVDAITQKYERAFEEDMAALGARAADIVCRATTHIGDMVAAIERLIEAGVAYEVEGDVWFAVERFPAYGRLSGRTLEDLRSGERVEPNPNKRHPVDFALWKAAKEGEPSWPSPWGAGRPGWHIECSVMSTKYLGMPFDLHGGGSDLIFPHHENEIAEAEATGGSSFVRHWLHAGMVQMGETKMSKSLGNIVLAHDAIAQVGGEPLRYWALSASYRAQTPFTEEVLADARASYERWQTFAVAARHVLGDDYPVLDARPVRAGDEVIDDPFVARFVEAMDDDFNSAGAFAVVHEVVRDANKAIDSGDRETLLALTRTFVELSEVLGFAFESDAGSSELVGGLVEYLLELREAARAERAFERADQIRDRLTSLGVVIEDTSAGPRWRVGPAPD
ncbi:MAG TPA: cysteine--tRNA ligase [Actinomycetota bacterium]|nr:cysteine--tRNA ligase [Actinomycetota bacterium]